MTTTANLATLAGEAYRAFETRERRPDDTFVTLKDDAPAWVREIVRTAHGDMLPDDWRYEAIREAFGAIADAEDSDPDTLEDETAHEFAYEGADIYTSDLIEWLRSNVHRIGYCDEALTGHFGGVENTAQLFQLGQASERREVFDAVLSGLRDKIDSD